MPIKKASWKHWRQTKRRTARNQTVRRATDTALKLARRAVVGKASDAEAKVKAALTALDKAAQKRILKRNTASRLKSRLMKRWHASRRGT